MKKIAALGAAALVASVPAVAQASHGGHDARHPATIRPIADGLAGPLQIAVGRRGSVLVAQDFAGVLTRVSRTGAKKDLTSNPGGEIAGVDHSRRGIYYTSSIGGQNGFTSGLLNVLRRGGRSSVVADLLAYEQRKNPDHVNTYGFATISDTCAAQLPDELKPAKYRGHVDAHPYAVAAARSGEFVADAGANDILWVSPRGRIRTVAVLPPQRVRVTRAIAQAQHLPDCTIGLRYGLEPVPTDVEIGRDGFLYVTTLPGGPEDGSLGDRGAVWRVNPITGRARAVARGLAGATNLALGPNGSIFVAQLNGDRVSRVGRDGRIHTVVETAKPASVEYAYGRLYIGHDVFSPSGKVGSVKVGQGHSHR